MVVQIRINRNGKGGRPRIGLGGRVNRSGCSVAPETDKQLNAWEEALRRQDPKINPGKVLDMVVQLVQKRIGEAAFK